MKTIDLQGQRFGRLLITHKVSGPSDKYIKWHAVCDCGKEKDVLSYNLLRGKTKSCGCLRRDMCVKRLTGVHSAQRMEFGQASLNVLFGQYQNAAKRRGLSFELNLSQFSLLTQKICYYCGAPPQQTIRRRRAHGHYIYNGIDRLDNSFGYALSNCVPCCGACNRMKLDVDHDDFLSKILQIYIRLLSPLTHDKASQYDYIDLLEKLKELP